MSNGRANAAVAKAIQDGTLKRQPCCRCNAIKAVAHHEDYSKPLDVIWLCRRHHAQRHSELRGGPFSRLSVTVKKELKRAINDWRGAITPIPSLSDAFRQLIELGLKQHRSDT